ncbi:MAG: hypothetical protein FD131_2038 [Rhodocyclaceae bacterium]|nr:MAG: hypothetical protein FD131_2038 [Rhodocyclaceae bacterium]
MYQTRKSVASLLLSGLFLPALALAQNLLEPFSSSAGTALGEAIRHSRNAAIGQAKPIPVSVRNQLKDFFPDSVLDRAKFKVGDDGVLNLARNTLFNPNVGAMTLDDVIVFRSEDDSQGNISLWAHELRHVQQYLEWGVHSFAVQYVRDSGRVENEAYAHQARVDRLTGNLGPGCSSARQVVEELYRSILERAGEEQGIRHNATLLNTSQINVRQLVEAFVGSEEHLKRFAEGRASEDQIRTLYRHALAREGEPKGVVDNVNALNAGNYRTVIAGFIYSTEYTNRFGDWTVPSRPSVKYCG